MTQTAVKSSRILLVVLCLASTMGAGIGHLHGFFIPGSTSHPLLSNHDCGSTERHTGESLIKNCPVCQRGLQDYQHVRLNGPNIPLQHYINPRVVCDSPRATGVTRVNVDRGPPDPSISPC